MTETRQATLCPKCGQPVFINAHKDMSTYEAHRVIESFSRCGESGRPVAVKVTPKAKDALSNLIARVLHGRV